MQSYAYGFPRLGENREFKKEVEQFWKGGSSETLSAALALIQARNLQEYAGKANFHPDSEITPYDAMLDAAILCGVYDPSDLKEYYDLCRGADALEMTKWFNTNYHYLVPDLSGFAAPPFRFNRNPVVTAFKNGQFPHLIGPFTLLKLSKGVPPEKFGRFFWALLEVYIRILAQYPRVQLDEPAFALELSRAEVDLIRAGYERLGGASTGSGAGTETEITLMTYYGPVDFLAEIFALPVAAIGLDFVRGTENYDFIQKHGFPKDKTLIAGLVDGRNVWRNDVADSVAKLRALQAKAGRVLVSNAAPLSHLPVTVDAERAMAPELKANLAFAREKLDELRLIADCFDGKPLPAPAGLGAYGKDAAVQRRVRSLTPADFVKKTSLAGRRVLHESVLKLPDFPTTTIGSFPQTEEVRRRRAEFREGKLSRDEYRHYIEGEIAKLVEFQEEAGLDVLVHGEFERTDMVEFFAQNLEGIATTRSGWILSYGTRAYRPPVIFGDVKRPKPMTVDEIRYAQSLTKKPVKGMLTGAVTILAWSFSREDVPVEETAHQISLALRDEILDYEKAGIRIVQVDEAAFREKAPLRRKDWPAYFGWAVKSFNLATNTRPETQIHTHMCYSEFGEIIDHINRMDFDVISIEASRSKGDIIAFFENAGFRRQIGLGIWDIHSPAVPTAGRMTDIVQRSLHKIPSGNFWLNPDCGLKTRQWPEVKRTLVRMVEVAKELRSMINLVR